MEIPKVKCKGKVGRLPLVILKTVTNGKPNTSISLHNMRHGSQQLQNIRHSFFNALHNRALKVLKLR